jgi:hypothetical protein
MLERRISAMIAAVIVFLVSAVLWDAFFRSNREPAGSGPVAPASSTVASVVVDSTAAGSRAALTAPPPLPAPALAARGGPTYMELFARSETRRRIRASAGVTYLNEVVAQSRDSMLHRWDNRILRPVRVYLAAGGTPNFEPAYLDAVRSAFQRWQDAGVPVRFKLDADSESAEVRFEWRLQFEMQRTGQTDLTWDADGHLQTATMTLATFDPSGRPLATDDVRVVALHEIGHLIGLDHSSDSTDVMYATTKVRDLSPRDIASAVLLYELPPGSLR